MQCTSWHERAQALWRAHWFAAGPWRTLAEGLVVQLVALAWALGISQAQGFSKLTAGGGATITLAGPCAILYCVFRLRAPTRRWRLALYLALGMALAIVPSAIISHILLATLNQRRGTIPANNLWIFTFWWYVAFVGAFLLSRGCAWLIGRWDHLRRGHLVWSLTHAHLMVVVIAAVLLSALVLTQSIRRGEISATALPILFFLFLVTCAVLVIVLPPSALFSYLFARTMTRRLERLAAATSALRAGTYDIRVRVEGEDEVAQLQANFNAMADALERALREVQTERDIVAGLLRSRRELVASVSHELRTPLATLRSYLESASTHWTDAPPPTLPQDLAIMERETLHLQRLVEDLFTLSRAEVGRLEMRLTATDVGVLARRLAEVQAPLAWQMCRVALVAEVAPAVPPALADGVRLEQIMRNLVQNGVRHTPPGGIVALGVSAEDEHVLIEVRDTGEGIAAADLPRIWERFYRTEASRERPESGSGLGLALVKELAEAMGGTAAVTSTLGHGSRFRVRLPRAPRPTAQSRPAVAKTPIAGQPAIVSRMSMSRAESERGEGYAV
jgi:signal transduction histidine kinase